MLLRSRHWVRALDARGALWAAALLWVFHGCSGGQSGAELTSGPGGEDPGGGNPGAVECVEDAECAEALQSDLDRLSQPAPLDVAFSGSRCEPYNVILEAGTVSGNACECLLPDGGSRNVGPVGVGCYATGRGGDCLFGDEDFAGCAINDASSCQSVCAELETRMEADAARSFAVELVHAACTEDGSCQSVVSIDGRCYANRDYSPGRSYDCSLGAAAILEAHAADVLPPERDVIPEQYTSYVAGTSGMLELGVYREWYGTAPQPLAFGAYAQFFEPIEGEGGQYGEVLDPLEGVDDCGMVRLGSLGFAPDIRMQSVAAASLLDGDSAHALEEFRSSAPGYYSYSVDLLGAGAEPRFGGSYGFRASGGSFGASIELADIVLPEELSFPELEAASRLPRGDIALTWTGRGQAPLRLGLQILSRPDDYSNAYQLECLVADDGAFTLGAELLAAAPDGFALLEAIRERREIRESAGRSLQTIAHTRVYHRFWLGASCDGAALMAACRASAELIDAEYTKCGLEPQPVAARCPDYLLESCGGCVEYFECLGTTTACEEQGLVTSAGCACP